MKRIGFLFERAFTPESLATAFHAAARHKHGKRACFESERHLASNLDALDRELHDDSYRPRPYHSFMVYEPKPTPMSSTRCTRGAPYHSFMVYEPKPRRIFAPAFRDLAVQYAIYALIGPIFDRTFIAQSFACRAGYGTHKAADYVQKALRSCPPGSYTLKLDIRKFLYRIDRASVDQCDSQYRNGLEEEGRAADEA